MRYFTLVLSCLAFVFTALPFIHTNHWWIRIFDFPRAQIALLCLIAIFLLFYYFNFKLLKNRIIISLVAGAFLYQTSLIINYTPLVPVEVKKGMGNRSKSSFTILQSNVKMDNRQVEKFKQMVFDHKPDIVSINEPDAWWAKQLNELQNMYPYIMKMPLPNTYGMMLFSKFPLKNEEINFLIENDVPSFFATIQLPSGQEFDLHCLHPRPPRPGNSTRERDIELLVVGNRIRKNDRPAIVVGDLNDVAWSYTSKRFQKLARVLDPRVGRGLYNTYNVFIPLLRYPLDHFFHTDDFKIIDLMKLEPFGSDHYPMAIHLEYQS